MKLIQGSFKQNIQQASAAIDTERYIKHQALCSLLDEIERGELIKIDKVEDSINYTYTAKFIVASVDEINDLINTIKRYESVLPPLLYNSLLQFFKQ